MTRPTIGIDRQRYVRSVASGALVMAALSACSGDDDAASDHDSGSGHEDGGGDGGRRDTIMLTLLLSGSALQGFVFCNTDAEALGCATSGADGRVTLEVPADSDVALTVDRDGYLPLLFHRRTGSEDASEGLLPLPDDSRRTATEEALGFELEAGKGVAVVNVTGGVGGTVSASPVGPRTYYWMSGIPVPDATTIASAAAAWYNLDPGDYEFTVEVPDKDCTVYEASWAGDEPNVVRARVVADRWSWFNIVDCVDPAG
jgi:hypothetical protein